MISHHSGISQWMPLLLLYTMNSPSSFEIQSLIQWRRCSLLDLCRFQPNGARVPCRCKLIQRSWSQVLCGSPTLG